MSTDVRHRRRGHRRGAGSTRRIRKRTRRISLSSAAVPGRARHTQGGQPHASLAATVHMLPGGTEAQDAVKTFLIPRRSGADTAQVEGTPSSQGIREPVREPLPCR